MKSIDINQALPKIYELLEMAFAGEEIIITKNNQEQQIKIISCSVPSPRPTLFGSDKGRIYMSDDFDDPLDDFEEYM